MYQAGTPLTVFSKVGIVIVFKVTNDAHTRAIQRHAAILGKKAMSIRAMTAADKKWLSDNAGVNQERLDLISESINGEEPDVQTSLRATANAEELARAEVPEMTLEDAKKIITGTKWEKVRMMGYKRLSAIEEELVIEVAKSLVKSNA
jgi:hypothetical protein